MQELTKYIIDFLSRFPISQTGIVHYGNVDTISDKTRINIIPAFENFEITVLPKIPFEKIENTPILYGKPEIIKRNGVLFVYADIIVSSFFLLSRYEEILKINCRDQHGRFLAKDAIIFQQGYGDRPLVDEYGFLLRKWLREVFTTENEIIVPIEKRGFNKISLTHDIDIPFRFERFTVVYKQIIKNILKYNYISSPFKKYLNEQYDNYYTFPKMINYDENLRIALKEIKIESIYFLITAGSFCNRKYYDLYSKKIDRLINTLKKSGAEIGLHISYEAGIKPEKINCEIEKYKNKIKTDKFISRHHFLSWREPEDVVYIEKEGITDDYSLGYADSIGFRVGTCLPYKFINPRSKKITNIIVHPLEIMEVTLSRQNYMNLDYDNAFIQCKKIIDQTYKNNGEIVLLWHNDSFLDSNYFEKLYKNILEYIVFLTQ
ncbi:MAG: polysaccharide deacetylase family protein [Methanobrevibacter sp.]|nr:polysaccharide deacetylase family protein [Methanobrevibacter sp.]